MQPQSKFLGICILVSSLIIGAALVFHANKDNSVGRYQFHPSNPPGVIWILDTTTGEVKTQRG